METEAGDEAPGDAEFRTIFTITQTACCKYIPGSYGINEAPGVNVDHP